MREFDEYYELDHEGDQEPTHIHFGHPDHSFSLDQDDHKPPHSFVEPSSLAHLRKDPEHSATIDLLWEFLHEAKQTFSFEFCNACHLEALPSILPDLQKRLGSIQLFVNPEWRLLLKEMFRQINISRGYKVLIENQPITEEEGLGIFKECDVFGVAGSIPVFKRPDHQIDFSDKYLRDQYPGLEDLFDEYDDSQDCSKDEGKEDL